MADHDTAVELFYDGAWNAAPVYTRDGITVSRGAPGEGQDSPPSAANLTLDNSTGDYNPRNPTGALYGLAGRNTPIRVSADGSVRSTTEAASWAPQRAIVGDARTPIEGGGILRRLQQGTTPLRSPAVRGVLAEDPVAFWPLEDGQGATQAASGLVGGTPLVLGVAGSLAFARGTGLTGSPNLIDMTATTGLLTAPVAGSGSGWGVEYAFRMPSPQNSPPGGVATIMEIETTGTMPKWQFFADVDMNAVPFNPAGTPQGATGTGPSVNVFDGDYHHVRMDVVDSGADVRVDWHLDGVAIASDTYTTETAGHVTRVTLNPLNPFSTTVPDPSYVDMPTALGYLAIYDGTTPTTTTEAALGYVGEHAATRFTRLGDEEGVPTFVTDTGSAGTQAMGPQPSDTLVNLLRECARTDGGLMYEPRTALGITMRAGRDLYNQDSALDLSFTGQEIAPTLQPILDDQGTRNDVTVKNRNGSSARAVKTTGPLNVSDPITDPEGVGRFDTSIDVNTETDDVLLGHATWHLHKGTVDEPRYPSVTVDLDAAPSLITAVNDVQIGDRITISDLPVDWSPDGANLLVLGIRESLPPLRRLVTFVCAPASPYEIAIVGDGAAGLTDLRGQAIDSDTLTLGSSVVYNATSLSVASSGLLLNTDSDDWDTGLHGGGLYLVLGGETVRVTNITGASSPQTVTVVRSINGVQKAHASGTVVHVRYPAVVGL